MDTHRQTALHVAVETNMNMVQLILSYRSSSKAFEQKFNK